MSLGIFFIKKYYTFSDRYAVSIKHIGNEGMHQQTQDFCNNCISVCKLVMWAC